MASLQAGYSSGSQGTSYGQETSSSKAESKVDRTQAGLSVGYRSSKAFLPYLSYLHESYDVTTTIENTNGSFGPYKDKGNHQFLAIGIMTDNTAFMAALEYNLILIDWERAAEAETQNLLAFRSGFAW
jgi:hypothetical protein